MGRIYDHPVQWAAAPYELFKGYIHFLRRSVDNCSPMPNVGKFIYATRRGLVQRIPSNNGKLERWFSSHGFSVIDFGDYTLGEQVGIATNAKMIVGLHGANLTNAVFMLPGAMCCEIMPTGRRSDPAYERLSRLAGIAYTRVDLPDNGEVVDLATLEPILDLRASLSRTE